MNHTIVAIVAVMTNVTYDVVVVGSGTGMAAALAAREQGLSVLVVEKSEYVGGSTARSGGAFWVPGNAALKEAGIDDDLEAAFEYVEAVVSGTAASDRIHSFIDHGPDAIAMLTRTTPLSFMWTPGYSDYHPENRGGSAVGRTCEPRPFNASKLGVERKRLRPTNIPIPIPFTSADFRLINLAARQPLKGMPRLIKRVAQGIGGLVFKREYVSAGQALTAGMFAGAIRNNIPVWTSASVTELITEDRRVTGVIVQKSDEKVTVIARRGVILASGGFDHDMAMRRKYQSEALVENLSLGAESNTGDAIRLAQDIGATVENMDQAWWFPAGAPLPGGQPMSMLADRSLPGSFMVDQTGRRFINESVDYMTFGQELLAREKRNEPVEAMWLIFDQKYRNSYVLATQVPPLLGIPRSWFDAGVAVRATSVSELANKIGVEEARLVRTVRNFNASAARGVDPDFHRGDSAYDRYYGDPTNRPNPNLRPLSGGTLYAVKTVLSDLGTCGGLRADPHARVLREDGSPIEGLFAVGNTAASVFGHTYPGAGATIGQGVVFGYIAAQFIARGAVAD